MEQVQINRDVQRQQLLAQIFKKHGEPSADESRQVDQDVNLDDIEKELNEAIV